MAFEKDDEYSWIGFDTAHYGDGRDIEKVREYFGEDRAQVVSLFVFSNFKPRSLEYCQDECKKIVDQLIELRTKGD